MKQTIALLLTRQYDLLELSASMSADGENLYFDGVNVHVRDESGSTNCGSTGCNALGNLIIGYDEFLPYEEASCGGLQGVDENGLPVDDCLEATYPKTGSHNLVVGSGHSYSSYGGLVAGRENQISGPYSTVTGGIGNRAEGSYTSVSGGQGNVADGPSSTVSGGWDNHAVEGSSSVSGGLHNETRGRFSAISGGSRNKTLEAYSAICGGHKNEASGKYSSVSGGYQNKANGRESTVSGGKNRSALYTYDWTAGVLYQAD